MKERAHWRFARIFVLLAVVVALLAMLGMAGFAAEADTAERECYLSGDLNGDGDLTPKDAIYALYSGFFGQESYPISQDWDYDANGKHNSRDAIELLYACYGMSDKVSTDMVHDYHDPVWSWNDAGDTISVSVTFKCGCQDAFIVTGTTEGAELTLRELEEQRVEASCLTSGQRVYQAAVSYKGKEYTSEPYTVTVAPTGHSTGDMVKVEGQPDYHGKFCSACESYVGVAEHNWKENGTVESAMPCSTPSQHYHLCQVCGDKVDIATHDFGEPVITREPTCKEHGSQSSFCTWARKGTLEDFGTHKNSGVWAVMDPTELGGEICTLAFRVRKDQADFNTAVSCRVILKNDDAFVADQTVQTRLTVLEASKQTQPQVTGPVFPSPATQPEADHDHDHDHDHEQTVDPDSILSAGERAGNVAVFFVTVGLLGLGAALAMKKKRRR